jgi:hypothetical protein
MADSCTIWLQAKQNEDEIKETFSNIGVSELKK